MLFHYFEFCTIDQACLAGDDKLVAFFKVARDYGDDFNTVVETLPKGDGHAVGRAVLVGEHIAVVAAGELQDTLVICPKGRVVRTNMPGRIFSPPLGMFSLAWKVWLVGSTVG